MISVLEFLKMAKEKVGKFLSKQDIPSMFVGIAIGFVLGAVFAWLF